MFKRSGLFSAVMFWLVMAFLYLPIATIILLSFNKSGLPTHWDGFSTTWYSALLQQHELLASAVVSLMVAVASTAIATVIGTLLAIGVESGKQSILTDTALFAPMVIPDIVLAIALLSFFSVLNITLGLQTIILSHSVFNVAFVAAVVRARMKNFDWSIIEASIDLGATRFTTLRRILLPVIFPGIVAGAMVAFTLSFDEFIIAYFNAGPSESSTTLPMRIYGMVRFGVTPVVNAAATLMLIASALILFIAQRSNREAY
jgi:spermidine/putrescine transport system permease protein